jgi:hypothetical protein
VIIKSPDSRAQTIGQMFLSHLFFHLDNPVIDLGILFFFQVIVGHFINNLLEIACHISEEAYPDDFYQHLKHVFVISMALNVTVAHRCECCKYPIDAGDVQTEKVIELDTVLDIAIDPAFVPELLFSNANHDPATGKYLRYDRH